MIAATSGRAWTSLVLGVLIFFVPFATGTTSVKGDTNFAYSNYAVGVVVAILAAVCIWAATGSVKTLAWLEGVNAVLGVWAIITPFVFTNTTNAMYANVVLGVILVIVAGWDAYVGLTKSGSRTMTRRGRTV